jgi:hypothetical protein
MALLVLALLSAEPRDARLGAAVAHYEAAEFAAAKDALIDLLDVPALSKRDHAEVRAYLAASYLALKDKKSAKLQLKELAQEQPDARPSPAKFGPDLMTLANDVWSDAERKRVAALEAPPPAPSPPPSVEIPSPPADTSSGTPSFGYALLPFGISDFVLGKPSQGVAWLAAEAGCFVGSAILLAVLESMKDHGAVLMTGYVTRDKLDAANALNVAYSALFFTGLVVVVGEIAKALITWPSERM